MKPAIGVARVRVASRVGRVLLGLVTAYFLAALVLGLTPVNRAFVAPTDGIEVFLITNGVHAGFALPLGPSPSASSPSVTADLAQAFSTPAEAGTGDARFLAIGWGDQRIYTETRTWAELRPVTAARALLGLGEGAVLHVERVGRPHPSAYVVPIRLDEAAYRRLADYILRSLQRAPDGRPALLTGASHGRHDVFYRATGRYTPLFTCNEWVRAGLATAGVRTAAWSPFDTALFHQARR